MEPLLPFPFVMKDDAIAPDPKEDDLSFCSLCDMEVGYAVRIVFPGGLAEFNQI